MRTVRLVLEYDGTRHSGWHAQGRGEPVHRPSVQSTVRLAVERITGESLEIRGASRTDAGVHARGQVAAFDTSKETIPIQGFLRGLNGYLPESVAVRDCSFVHEGFHPRHESRGKHYRYRYVDAVARSPLRRDVVWWQKRALDAEAMHEAAQLLLGTHDFEAFRAADCPAAHAVRAMYKLEVRRSQDEVCFDVVGNAFCRHMVRVFAGTLREVGLGKRSPVWVRDVLDSRDRRRAGMTAPAHGLCLEEVIYDDRLPPRPSRVPD